MSRDPIGEQEGLNLYGFVYNNPTFYFDYLGRNAGAITAGELVGESAALTELGLAGVLVGEVIIIGNELEILGQQIQDIIEANREAEEAWRRADEAKRILELTIAETARLAAEEQARRDAENSRLDAERRRKRRRSQCEFIHALYKKLKCKKCPPCTDPDIAKARAMCWGHMLTLRGAYMAMGCDWVLNGPARKPGGRVGEIGRHADEVGKAALNALRCGAQWF